MDAIEEKDGYVLVRIRVQPKASRNAIRLEPDGRIRMAITAPPVDGAANEAVVAQFAKSLGLSKRQVSLAAGARGREKTLHVTGCDARELRTKLER